MQVRVRLTGIFREWVGVPAVEVDLPSGGTLRDLLAALASLSPRLGRRLDPLLAGGGDPSDVVLAVADGRVLRAADPLPAGAEVTLFPPLEGGSGGGRGPGAMAPRQPLPAPRRRVDCSRALGGLARILTRRRLGGACP